MGTTSLLRRLFPIIPCSIPLIPYGDISCLIVSVLVHLSNEGASVSIVHITTKYKSQIGIFMRSHTVVLTISVAIFAFAGCATTFRLTPENLEAQLKADQRGESAVLASTIADQIPNQSNAESVTKLLCTNPSGDSVWVYTNKDTQLQITTRTGDMMSMYFDTVVLDGTKIKGVTSRVRKSEQEVELSDILKIDVYTVNSKTELVHPS